MFAVFIFLGRPRFLPAIFLPFLLSFFFRALEGDGFLTEFAAAFSSSAPESYEIFKSQKLFSDFHLHMQHFF